MPSTIFRLPLKEFCKVLLDREGVLEAKPSADGSVIATMTREAHKKSLDDLKASIDETFADYYDDGDESDFSDYTYNDDMTVFTVNMDADYESPYTTEAMLFGISAEGYQALNGVETRESPSIILMRKPEMFWGH